MRATTQKAIESEMMARRCELITLQNKNGGCVSIKLVAENVEFVYNPTRKVTSSNPRGDKFYITGVLNGSPVIINEFDVYDV